MMAESTINVTLNTTSNTIPPTLETTTDTADSSFANSDYYHSALFDTDGYYPQMELDLEPIDYIYGPIVTGIAVISSCLIVFTFLRPSMLSPTTILLSGIVVCQTIFAITVYGNYLYIYFTYGPVDIFLFYPECILAFAGKTVGRLANDTAFMLIACVAIQRILLVRFPIKSRLFLSNKVSTVAVLVCFLVAGLYRIPYIYFYGNFMTLRDFVVAIGKNESSYEYYYYYYYYYYDYEEEIDTNQTYVNENSTYIETEDIDESLQYCMSYRDPTFERFYTICNPVFNFIPFAILSFSTFYLIHSVKYRGKSQEKHESESSVQRIRNMTRCILIFLTVELLQKVLNLFFNISAILTLLGYDVFIKMKIENIAKLTKAWEMMSCAGSIINFWIYVISSEQFRKEMIATFTCKYFRNRFRRPGRGDASTKASTISSRVNNSKT